MVTRRQETILRLIVNDYISTAAPISSDVIARHRELGVSPATIRNDVADLEERDYLMRPHTSAGSVPLDKAYRFYVESILTLEDAHLPYEVQAAVRRELNRIEREIDEWTNVAAAVLAKIVGNMAIATFPMATQPRVKHVELVPIRDILAMLIVVLEQAGLRRQLIRLQKPSPPEELEASVNRVKSRITGLTRSEIEALGADSTPLEDDVIDATLVILREEDTAIYRDYYVDGLRNLLSQPEFAHNDRMRSLVEGLEDGSLVKEILGERPDGGVVKVVIGHENNGDVLSPLSVVLCGYGIPDRAYGAVGAIGPTRMEYSRAIAGVRLMSAILSDMVESVGS